EVAPSWTTPYQAHVVSPAGYSYAWAPIPPAGKRLVIEYVQINPSNGAVGNCGLSTSAPMINPPAYPNNWVGLRWPISNGSSISTAVRMYVDSAPNNYLSVSCNGTSVDATIIGFLVDIPPMPLADPVK